MRTRTRELIGRWLIGRQQVLVQLTFIGRWLTGRQQVLV